LSKKGRGGKERKGGGEYHIKQKNVYKTRQKGPKYSIDDVMNQLNSQFSDVKKQLSVIYNKMQKQDIDAYRAVEDAVTAANSDIKLNSVLDLISRGSRFFDQLNIFSKGMLGENGFSADILQVTSDLLKVLSLLFI